jgi:hypothetical protein
MSVRHNFNNATRRAQALVSTIGELEMTKQTTYYGTATDGHSHTCKYSLSSYFAMMFEEFVPCCHMMSVGVPRLTMNVPPVLCYTENRGLHLERQIGSRLAEPPSLERRDSLIEMDARTIKNLSRTSTGIDDIRRWVLENIPPSDQMSAFVMNISVPILN